MQYFLWHGHILQSNHRPTMRTLGDGGQTLTELRLSNLCICNSFLLDSLPGFLPFGINPLHVYYLFQVLKSSALPNIWMEWICHYPWGTIPMYTSWLLSTLSCTWGTIPMYTSWLPSILIVVPVVH